MKRTVNVGLIGFGTVGAGVAKILLADNRPFQTGRHFEIELLKIADLDITTDRGITVPDGVLTTNVDDILANDDIDVVIELIGGYEPAKAFTLKAFAAGKSVVTANKALVAKHGDELFSAAKKAGVSYMFEASVGGGIPIIRSVMDGLNANTFEKVYGILNGTTNYILTGMARDGSDYADVLASAQKLGYAEADPTSDVSGGDALNKIVILARLAFGAALDLDTIYCEGIQNISITDIEYANELGYTIKLLAIAKRHEDGRVETRVHPTLVPSDSVMASVEDEFNAVEVYGDAVGREIFYGKGAGMLPTASAVVSDIVDIAAGITAGHPSNVERIIVNGDGPELIDFGELTMRYYLRFEVTDQSGVLADIARILADFGISIESMIQIGSDEVEHVHLGSAGGGHVQIIIMTHEAKEADMQKALSRFAELGSVNGAVQLMRVEEI